jgi:hypothetical protein
MYGTNNIKFVIARQEKEVYHYKNTKEKLHRTNAAVWYNKLCQQLQLTPINIYFAIFIRFTFNRVSIIKNTTRS